MNFGRQGIAKITLISVAAATLAVVFAWQSVSLVIERRQQKAELVGTGDRIADRLAHTLAGSLWNFDHAEVEKIIAYEMRRPETLAILVLNEKGEVVAGVANRTGTGEPEPYLPSSDGGKLLSASVASSDRPVLVYGKPVGKVVVHLSDRVLMADLAASAWKAVAQSFILSAIIALFAWRVLAVVVIRPISRLDKSLASVRDGEFGKVEVGGAEEVGRLASTFNAMTERLKGAFDEQERLVKELRAHQEQFRSLASSVPGVLSRATFPAGTVIYLSENFTFLTGYSRADFFGTDARRLRDIVMPDDVPTIEKAIMGAVESGKPYDVEFRISIAKGDIRWVHETGRVASDDSGKPTWIDAVTIDVSEAKGQEEQFRQAQKMETIGLLAGGIAHDFNNILMAIIGATSLIRLRQEKDGVVAPAEFDELVAVVESASERAKGVVAQLLTLARRQDFQLVPLDLNSSLRHVQKLLGNTVDKSVRVEIQEAPGAAMVLGDPTQVEQVLLNLCVNSAHAMTFMRPAGAVWGGWLTMSVELFQPTQAFLIGRQEAIDGNYWRISVRDTGVGMTPGVLGKIFTPFFTTKEKGKGSGLGLSMVYSIVRGHRGFVDVASTPGEGTVFSVFMPVATKSGAVLSDATGLPEIPRGSGTVLIVDDEPFVRRLAKKALEGSGFSVLEAEDGEEAVKLYRSLHEKIDLVLLDMVMPVMSGREAFYRMRDVDPNVRVLLSSGFKQDARVQELLDIGVAGFIEKPYKVMVLAQKVVDLIAGKEER